MAAIVPRRMRKRPPSTGVGGRVMLPEPAASGEARVPCIQCLFPRFGRFLDAFCVGAVGSRVSVVVVCCAQFVVYSLCEFVGAGSLWPPHVRGVANLLLLWSFCHHAAVLLEVGWCCG